MPEAFNGVIDIGKVDHHEAYLAISDVLCLPSYREGFGSIVIDAAAMGVPAIGTRIAGLVDSIEDGKTGVLVPAGDISKFAGAMLSMIEDQPRRIKMGIAARHRVEADFTADKLYASLRDYYLSQCAATIVS
jgi:glycosyltransferase involved in cell wall biosynthesis